MNILQKIKAAWAVKSFAEQEFKEATMPTASGKPGWKTTEFWMNLASQAGILWGAVHGFVPPQYAAIISAVGIGVYTVARTVVKMVSDVKAAKAVSGETATATVSVGPAA